MLTPETPIVMLGPGGDFVTGSSVEAGVLVARPRSGLPARLHALAAQAARLLASEQLLGAHQAVVSGACQVLAGLSRLARGGPVQNSGAARPFGPVATRQEIVHEPHP